MSQPYTPNTSGEKSAELGDDKLWLYWSEPNHSHNPSESQSFSHLLPLARCETQQPKIQGLNLQSSSKQIKESQLMKQQDQHQSGFKKQSKYQYISQISLTPSERQHFYAQLKQVKVPQDGKQQGQMSKTGKSPTKTKKQKQREGKRKGKTTEMKKKSFYQEETIRSQVKKSKRKSKGEEEGQGKICECLVM